MKSLIAALFFTSLSLAHLSATAQETSPNALLASKDTAITTASDETDEFWTGVKVSLLIAGIYWLYWVKAGVLKSEE